MNYHVRFDQVEVFQLRRHSSRDVTLHTRTKYQIDSFELGRQTKRRSMKRFHRSDLYREWVVTHGLKVNNESDGTSLIDDIFLSPSPTDKVAMEKSQKAAKHKNPQVKGIKIVDDETDVKSFHDIMLSSPSAIDRLAMDKIKKADETRTTTRLRRRNLFYHRQRRRSGFSAVREVMEA